ncbi:heavy metal translocating P-type ATPase [Granulicatella seriolae]|uniref:Cd(2+)-exporting ATPase n=1 Tax=Granulicatella seriolae TaxID=2967226 RepID=A0ABT1WKV5_9LACT|nr:cation-translocating P-type ATPase [Granulicatella seriolae]
MSKEIKSTCCESHTHREKENCCQNQTKVVTDSCCESTPSSSESNCCLEKEQSSCCSEDKEEVDDCCHYEKESKENTSPIKKTYQVSGMDCGSCALTIEKGLKQLSGIEEVQVNFSTGKMNVTVSNNDILNTIPKHVEKLGYQLVQTLSKNEHTLKVTGMDCGGCAQTIEKHFSKMKEIDTVSVSFANGSMVVAHTNPLTEIKKELKKLGYQGVVEKEQTAIAKKGTIDSATKNLILSGILLLLGYGSSVFSINLPIAPFFFAASMMISGWRPARSAFYAVQSKSLDMNVLMVTAAIGAGIIGEWGEGALVVFLFAIGNYLQNKAVERTRRSIQGLMDLTPQTAFVKSGTTFVEVAVENILLGDTLLVKAGERIPLDGLVTKGNSMVDQSPITGESIPVYKSEQAEVFAGTINQEGSLEIKVTHLSEDSTIAHIIQMVEDAQANKAPSEAFVDKFAKIYTPIVFILALGVMILPTVVFQADFATWFYRGLELLVVACPCALIISTPVSIVSAIGNAAKNGVLIKGGTFLEKAGELTAIAFDKTGTITEGKPQVTEVSVYEGSKETFLQILASLEGHTTHPIGKAIVSFVEEQELSMIESTDFQTITGKGIEATIDGQKYYAGSTSLFSEKVFSSTHRQAAENLEKTGHTIVFLGTDTKIIGLVGVADKIRQTSKDAITQLSSVGIRKTVMLTGDNQGAAQKIANEAGVSDVKANLLPEDKVLAIEELKQQEVVAMIGDGINDAPALAIADLGIAMGGAGTDTAIETADIVLMADNLEKLPYTIDLSKRALKIIKQNIIFSLVIKLIALVFIFPGWLSLWMAVLSDSGAAVIVTLNALRLAKIKK